MTLTSVHVRNSCKKFLSYDYSLNAQDTISRIADYASAEFANDDFGTGQLVDLLENRLQELLGKEAVVFMPTGRMAQLIGLKLWCERQGNSRVAMHPRCHMEESEDKGYARAYELQAVALGHPNRITEVRDLVALQQSVGAISIEIPLLALGCRLPPWTELVDISQYARDRRIPLHADAARLWESQPYYDQSYAEIAALFDSLYVSMYKGLSAIAGGVLAGPKEFIDSARLYQTQVGGTPRILSPYLLDSLRALDHSLPLMWPFYEKARSLASALRALPNVWITPDPPETNTFLVALKGPQIRLRECAMEVAVETGLWLVDYERSSNIDGLAQFQVVVGEATLDVKTEEAVKGITRLSEKLAGRSKGVGS